ncbi:MAG: hypothetical protein AABW48_06215 [Nanoarchaeota archaeon]
MARLPLANFRRSSIDQLIEEHLVGMVYDYSLIGKNNLEGEGGFWAWWHPAYNLIRISPDCSIKKDKYFENLVIVHEWLHAYEDLILEMPTRFTENQIGWWAAYHNKKDPGLATYVRNKFADFGF